MCISIRRDLCWRSREGLIGLLGRVTAEQRVVAAGQAPVQGFVARVAALPGRGTRLLRVVPSLSDIAARLVASVAAFVGTRYGITAASPPFLRGVAVERVVGTGLPTGVTRLVAAGIALVGTVIALLAIVAGSVTTVPCVVGKVPGSVDVVIRFVERSRRNRCAVSGYSAAMRE